MTTPQVVTITAGNVSAVLDTATIARALVGIECAIPWLHRDAVAALTKTLADVCDPNHLHDVYAPQSTTTGPTL